MDKIESAGVVLVAFAAAGYLLAGAKGLEMSRTARYVIASILIAIGLLQLTALMSQSPKIRSSTAYLQPQARNTPPSR